MNENKSTIAGERTHHTMECLAKGDASKCPICKPINDAAARQTLLDLEHQRDALEEKLERVEHERDSLEAQLHTTSVDASELLCFANLVEPYVSNAHCHGASELDHKLYDACLKIRKVIRRNVIAYLVNE